MVNIVGAFGNESLEVPFEYEAIAPLPDPVLAGARRGSKKRAIDGLAVGLNRNFRLKNGFVFPGCYGRKSA